MGNIERDFFPARINQRVPDMEYAADIDVSTGAYMANLGAPATADPDGILDGVTISHTAVQTFTSTDYETAMQNHGDSTEELDATYGRALTYTGNSGADGTVTVTGTDYLGQVMVETATLNGTTPVAGTKAFKRVTEVVSNADGTGGTTLDLGWSDVLGLPYAAKAIGVELEDGVSATAGTFVAQVTTDPQTATTGDPRGTYDPNSACDGSKAFIIEIYTNTDNLHGVAHFSG